VKHLFIGTQDDNVKDCVNKGRLRHGDSRGENNGMSKLTATKVLEIRAMAEKGISKFVIAQQFGIHFSYVNTIASKKVWKNI
jgi:hypothetical protein